MVNTSACIFLQVTEILGRENLKLSKAQVTEMMKLLRKEEEIEQEEKRREKEEKLKESGINAGEDNQSNNSAEAMKS